MNIQQPTPMWSCPAYVPVSELIYAAFRSNAKHCLTAHACMCEKGDFPTQR